jgi:signal peptidase I
MNTLGLFAVFLASGFVLQATILWLAVRMCRLPRQSWARALAISVVRLPVVAGLWIALIGRDGDPAMTPAFGVAALVVDTLLTLRLIRRSFGEGWRASLGVWAAQMVGGLLVGFGWLVLVQTCLTTYVMPSSSMSPNIRGYHVVEVLPDGNHLIVAANNPADAYGIPAGDPSRGIVEETFESRETARPARYTAQADRFVCNKTTSLQLWDAVVVRHPQKPDLMYAKRLVGLPGESIVIRDRAVWVNGQRQTPPERLGPIRYRGSYRMDDEDAASQEIVLGPDEYYVLGDNPNKSSDSRDFGPVKRDLIEGVADLIYWPPARWRVRP